MNDVTEVLSRIEQGDPKAAEQLLPLIYHELREVAQAKLRNERAGHTLQATALVHEAYLRLVGDRSEGQSWSSRGHFFAAAAEAMRRILIESVRQKSALKRGGGALRIELEAIHLAEQERNEELLALDAAIDRLEEVDPVKASLVKLRFFSGLTNAEAAQALEISPATADRYWSYARAWLQQEMQRD
jgi:RNA polymerase sigma factor (TIGR02999 family)